ncbi:hypothetical protein HDU96_009680 [Phlyctochytrium bullatum]|nr:hypothetical protein HDU96_009680 [Phlyctochytrium bullatum]
MLQNIIAGSANLFDHDLQTNRDTMAEVERNPQLLKAWLHQMRTRLLELEKTSGAPPLPPPPRPSEDPEIANLIATLQENLHLQAQQLRTNEDAIRILSEENQQLRRDVSQAEAAARSAAIKIDHRAPPHTTNVSGTGPQAGTMDGGNEVHTLRERCAAMKAELEKCQDERDHERIVFASKEQDLLRSNAALAHRLRELEVAHKSVCDRRDALQREVNNLKAAKLSQPEVMGRKAEILARTVEAANLQNRELAAENRELRARIQAWQAEPLAQRLQNELAEARTTIEELEAEKLTRKSQTTETSGGEKDHSQWEVERLKYEEELARLREAVSSAGANEAQVKPDVEELTERLAAAESDNVKLHQDNEALNSERANLAEIAEELEQRVRLLELSQNNQPAVSANEDSLHLSQELELYKSRYAELEETVKTLREELEGTRATETSSQVMAEVQRLTGELNAVSAERDRLLAEADALKIAADTAQRDIEDFRLEAKGARAAAEHLHDELTSTKEAFKALEAEIKPLVEERNALAQRLKTGQQPVSNDEALEKAAMSELVETLKLQCDELAKQAQQSKQEADEAKAELDKLRAPFGNGGSGTATPSGGGSAAVVESLRGHISDLEGQLSLADDRLKRERETWRLREQTLYKEIERITVSQIGESKEVKAARSIIFDTRSDPEGALGLPSSVIKPEDVDLERWVRHMIRSYRKKRQELYDAHQMLDVQHEKLEDAIARTSFSVDGYGGGGAAYSSTPVFASRSGKDGSVDVAVQTDVLASFMRISTIKAALSRQGSGVTGIDTPARSRSSSITSTTSGAGLAPPRSLRTDRESGSLSELPSVDAFVAQAEEMEKMKAALSKLTSKYASLQQQHAATAQQLDHQLRANAEIKRLIVGTSIRAPRALGSGPTGVWGGSGDQNDSGAAAAAADGDLLEKYNDAILEVGALRSELERYRMRCEEVEEVVEQVFMQAVGLADGETEDQLREVAASLGVPNG